MDKFRHEKNLKYYRQLLGGAAHEAQCLQILKLMAEGEAKDQQPSRQM